jgi:hypothetical protein
MQIKKISSNNEFFQNDFPSAVYTSAACNDFFYLVLLIISINLKAKCFLCSSDIAKSLTALLKKQNLRIGQCIKLFAKATVSTTKSNPEPTERNVMSISIIELPSNILEALRVCYTELVIKRINSFMGEEENSKSKTKKSWSTSADFPKEWEEKFEKSSIDIINLSKNGGEIVINNIFDKSDSTAENKIRIQMDKIKFNQLTKHDPKKFHHRINFYHFVKKHLATSIQMDENLLSYLDQELFQSFIAGLK